MRTSQFFLPTLKETPADAELVSHRLMLRAGMIRKLASGLYTWLPMGLRVLAKVENIVREEMQKVGALEILMPLVQPAELWQASQRWDQYGKELLKFSDRHERHFCLGPTHEEVITDLMKNEIRSYKDLPKAFFQIATKFRDEIRPRFGVMRAREFLMKDAYSFNINQDSLDQTYEQMYRAYEKIFTRTGLKFRAVLADTGSIGGSKSHEFQVLADSGEDEIAFSDQSDYAANVELAESLNDPPARNQSSNTMETLATPGTYTIQALVDKFDMDIKKTVKTLIVEGADGGLIALILRGDHELNATKAEKHPKIADPLKLAERETIFDAIGAHPGSLGPVGLPLEVIVDPAAAAITDFSCGANKNDLHYINVNWDRDVPLEDMFDLRKVAAGDASPDGQGRLNITRGIEVGHIFQLGDKYSQALSASVLDKHGKSQTLQMGCYGIGISRIVAASIEQNHDQHGIIWPDAIAPFQIGIIPIQMHKSHRVREACEKLYQQLTAHGFEVLFDDRNERPGVMFSNLDLLGIPHRLVIGERGLDAGTIEYKARRSDKATPIEQTEIIAFFTNNKLKSRGVTL